MKPGEPSAFEAAADLRRMLQDLGRDAPRQERAPAQESAREARMAASIDAELDSLVRARRARRWTTLGLVGAAALFALVFGTPNVRWGGRVAISAEPITAAAVEPRPVAEPAAPPQVAPAAAAALPSVAPAASNPDGAPSRAPAPTPSSAPEPPSTLGEENQLFKDAAEAGRAGDVNGALSRLDKLLLEHPASPLAQTALVRKFRLLAKSGRADEAQREAARYLRLYPTGFALSEAQALAAATGQAPP